MAANDRPTRRAGPVERAAQAVPPPAGRAFRWIVVSLLAVSTVALVLAVGLLFLIDRHLQATDLAALKGEVAGVKSETASFHADTGKDLAGLRKGMADIANEVNAATLKLNDIALGLHKQP